MKLYAAQVSSNNMTRYIDIMNTRFNPILTFFTGLIIVPIIITSSHFRKKVYMTKSFQPEEENTLQKDSSESNEEYNELECDQRYNFYLPGSNECTPQLTCDDISKNIVVSPKVIAQGSNKQLRVDSMKNRFRENI